MSNKHDLPVGHIYNRLQCTQVALAEALTVISVAAREKGDAIEADAIDRVMLKWGEEIKAQNTALEAELKKIKES